MSGSFQRDGFLIIRGHYSKEEVELASRVALIEHKLCELCACTVPTRIRNLHVIGLQCTPEETFVGAPAAASATG